MALIEGMKREFLGHARFVLFPISGPIAYVVLFVAFSGKFNGFSLSARMIIALGKFIVLGVLATKMLLLSRYYRFFSLWPLRNHLNRVFFLRPSTQGH